MHVARLEAFSILPVSIKSDDGILPSRKRVADIFTHDVINLRPGREENHDMIFPCGMNILAPDIMDVIPV